MSRRRFLGALPRNGLPAGHEFAKRIFLSHFSAVRSSSSIRPIRSMRPSCSSRPHNVIGCGRRHAVRAHGPGKRVGAKVRSLTRGRLLLVLGGFFTNAEHADIVRAFAILPWIASVVVADWSRWTTTLVGGSGHPADLDILPVDRRLYRHRRRHGLCFWDPCLARMDGTRQLDPGRRRSGVPWDRLSSRPPWLCCRPYLDMALIGRASQINDLPRDYVEWLDVFTLIYRVENPLLHHDISMRSVFIGMPAVALLVMGVRHARAWRPWLLAMAFLCVGMGSGILLRPLVPPIPILGLSCFSFADYRGIFALSLVLMAARSFDLAEQSARPQTADDGRPWSSWP